MKELVGVDLTLLEGDPSLRADILTELGQQEFDAGLVTAQVRICTQSPAFRYPDRVSSRESFTVTQEADSLAQRQSLAPAVHRIILSVDIEGSTKKVNSTKAKLRCAMYDLTEKALRRAGITDRCREPFVDRGDSLLALIHPADEIPKSLLLDTVVPTLAELLAGHNQHRPDYAFRLRVVVHAGEVHYDSKGQFGESLDLAFRLLDAPEVKKRLTLALTAPLVLVVSADIYRSVVCQGYEGIDARTFTPVRLRVADHRHQGWVHVPPSYEPRRAPVVSHEYAAAAGSHSSPAAIE
jgi:hypothetical protein